MFFKGQAPGSLMLMGEYAVLHNGPALISAINKFITVNIYPRSDQQILLHSDLGEHHTNIDQLALQAPFEYVLASLLFKKKDLPCGCDIEIQREFSHTLGLGSSAAVMVATNQALNQWLNLPSTKKELWEQCYQILLTVQKKGSGADLAASIYGSCFFKNNPLEVTPISAPPLSVVYSGMKASTSCAILNTKIDTTFIDAMNALTYKAFEHIKDSNWPKFGKIASKAHTLLTGLGVSNFTLNRIVAFLDAQENIHGAKISGAGFGDCVIGIGELARDVDLAKLKEFHEGIKLLHI